MSWQNMVSSTLTCSFSARITKTSPIKRILVTSWNKVLAMASHQPIENYFYWLLQYQSMENINNIFLCFSEIKIKYSPQNWEETNFVDSLDKNGSISCTILLLALLTHTLQTANKLNFFFLIIIARKKQNSLPRNCNN